MEVLPYHGSRDALEELFLEAEDSPSQLATYRNLGEVLVAIDEGPILGHVLIVKTSDAEVFEIKSIAVRPERRSQGIGAALIAEAFAWCADRGARIIRLATAAASTDALKFYQRHGFRIREVIRDFYVPERGYRSVQLNGIPLRDELILETDPISR